MGAAGNEQSAEHKGNTNKAFGQGHKVTFFDGQNVHYK
jgi:hypothetical protein